MSRCGAVSPEHPLTCVEDESVPHDFHYAPSAQYGDPMWPNEDYVAPPPRTRSSSGRASERLKALADKVPPRRQAVARHDDPETSHAAALSVGDLRPLQRLVYDVLAAAGEALTDEEIFERLGDAMSVSGARTRRSELVDGGLVEDSGLRGITEANRQTIRWRVTTT